MVGKMTPLRTVMLFKGAIIFLIISVLYANNLIALKTAFYVFVAAMLVGLLFIYVIRATINDSKKQAVKYEADQDK